VAEELEGRRSRGPATRQESAKDRVGALLAITAAIVGLVLVFQDRETESHTAPAAPQSSPSQSVLAPTG
jgi:hypothetical protein